MSNDYEVNKATIATLAIRADDRILDYAPDHITNINALVAEIHKANVEAGWWTNHRTGETLKGAPHVFGEKMMLVVTELSEAIEGDRRDRMDDKLPYRKMCEVELADAVIRIFDLAGSRGYDLGGAIAERRIYNLTRADHQLKNRSTAGGKSY